MTKWWQRLQREMTSQGLSAEDVSASSGVPVKTVYGYLKGEVENPRGDTLAKLAASVGVSEEYLRYGGKEEIPLKRVPLLDMNELRTLNIGESPLDVWDGETTVAAPIDTPEDSFGVVLPNDANAPDFRKGDIVIFSPSAEIEPGCYVLAVRRLDGAHFERYKMVSPSAHDRFVLIHDNEHWPDVQVDNDQPGFIVARGIKHIRDI